MCSENENRVRRNENGGQCSCGCCGCGCRCGGSSGTFKRKFVTRAERIECLEGYLGQLESEAEGVRERIAELRAG